MQYTVRRIPKALDRALRERVSREHKSLNEVAIAAMARGLGLGADDAPMRQRDLSDLAGRWVKDRAIDRALEDQRTIDEELWR